MTVFVELATVLLDENCQLRRLFDVDLHLVDDFGRLFHAGRRLLSPFRRRVVGFRRVRRLGNRLRKVARHRRRLVLLNLIVLTA
jgi:hypothetical protein